jgi:hypothetical protein
VRGSVMVVKRHSGAVGVRGASTDCPVCCISGNRADRRRAVNMSAIRTVKSLKNKGRTMLNRFAAIITTTLKKQASRWKVADPAAAAADHPERGDVPGWVMITLMSAVLVAGLLALAGPALEGLFQTAMNQVAR